MRLEYTVGDTFDIYQNFTEGIRKVNYGATIGAGIQFGPKDGPLQFILDLQLSPDFSQQIFMPPGTYLGSYGGSTVAINVSEQKVINLAVEITAGFKFQRY